MFTGWKCAQCKSDAVALFIFLKSVNFEHDSFPSATCEILPVCAEHEAKQYFTLSTTVFKAILPVEEKKKELSDGGRSITFDDGY